MKMQLDTSLATKAKPKKRKPTGIKGNSMKLGYWNVDGFNEQSSWAVERILVGEVSTKYIIKYNYRILYIILI